MITRPQHGLLTNNQDGQFTYTPNSNFSGTDEFVYEVCDAYGACNQAKVIIEISSVNQIPIAGDDLVQTTIDRAVDIRVYENDNDPENELDLNSIRITTAPKYGKIQIGAYGLLTYYPNAYYAGADQFQYEICDQAGKCTTGTVNIIVE